MKPGKLHLKSKGKKRSNVTKKETAPMKQIENETEIIEKKENNDEDNDVLDSMTEAEAKFFVVNNKYKKRAIEKNASMSYQDQIAKLNSDLQKAPMHNDLEGD